MSLCSRPASRNFTQARDSHENPLDAPNAAQPASATAKAVTWAERAERTHPAMHLADRPPQQATATLNGVSAACIPSPVQTVARTRKCHSSLAVIAPSTAQTASGTIVPPPATRRLAKQHGIRPAKGPINRHRTQLSENRHGRFLANSCKRNLCFKKSLAV